MDKKGNIILYIIFSFIALILFTLLATVIPGVYDELKVEVDYAEITSFIATDSSNRTVYPGEEGIKTEIGRASCRERV